MRKEEMNLAEHYNELYKRSIKKIGKGEHQRDLLIDSEKDTRYGITLLLRPPEIIKDEIQLFLNELKRIDPSQYYYPGSDIHVTAMSIITCYAGFELKQISISEYIEQVRKSIGGINSFGINFKGITVSDSSIMLQGFPENESLQSLRNNLRSNFSKSDLEQSIDKRYKLQTAHSTVVRFRNELQNKKAFLEKLEIYKAYDFGDFKVREIELVFNDWYQRKNNTILLEKFDL